MKIKSKNRFNSVVTLKDAKHNDVCEVVCVDGEEEVSARLLDLGFVPNTKVIVHNVSPFGKTILVELRGYTLALRDSATQKIKVKILSQLKKIDRKEKCKICNEQEGKVGNDI